MNAILIGYDDDGAPIMGRPDILLDRADEIDGSADVITRCRADLPGANP